MRVRSLSSRAVQRKANDVHTQGEENLLAGIKNDKHNLEFREQRAAAIKEAQENTFAVDPQRLYAVGVGEHLPIEGTNADGSNNRRVQLVNLGVCKKKS